MAVEELNLNETKKPEDFNLDSIPLVESKSNINPRMYNGFRTKIAKVTVDKDAINWYNGPVDEKNRPTFNPDSTEKMWKVVVETYPLPEFDEKGKETGKLVEFKDEKGELKHLTVKARFNLQKQPDGSWGISKAPRASLWKFMRTQGARTLNELKDTIVTIGLQPDKDESSDKVWLKINN